MFIFIWAKETTFMKQLLSDFIGDFKYEIESITKLL